MRFLQFDILITSSVAHGHTRTGFDMSYGVRKTGLNQFSRNVVSYVGLIFIDNDCFYSLVPYYTVL